MAPLYMAMLAGCAPSSTHAPVVTAGSNSASAAQQAAAMHASDEVKPDRALFVTTQGPFDKDDLSDHNIRREEGDIALQLDVYEVTVPYGSLSNDDRFWNHIDEDHVDLANHEVLQMNGIRYGVAPTSDWKYFKALMDREGATSRPMRASPTLKGMLEIPLNSNIESETIWFVSKGEEHPVVSGKSYEKCDNLLNLTFEPAPRQRGDARISVCCVIRNLVKEIRPTLLNESRSYEWYNPERVYDLRLCQDVPKDHFLVIGPSSAASLPDNLGHMFLVHPGAAQETETILLLVPHPWHRVIETSRPAMKFNVAGQGK